ncbi:MAG: hypothetical protein OSA98_15005, partial [Rubripirellula sp.]|nr:hypothetical protein [Rubripirellula sp.]
MPSKTSGVWTLDNFGQLWFILCVQHLCMQRSGDSSAIAAAASFTRRVRDQRSGIRGQGSEVRDQ